MLFQLILIIFNKKQGIHGFPASNGHKKTTPSRFFWVSVKLQNSLSLHEELIKLHMTLKRKSRRLTRPEPSPGRDSLKTLLERFVPAGGAAPYLLSPALRNPAGQTRLKRKSRRLPTFPRIGVSSARGCLTSVFGTGTGISTPPWPPAYKCLD